MHAGVNGGLRAEKVHFLVTPSLIDTTVTRPSVFWATNAGGELEIYRSGDAIRIKDLLQCWSKSLASGSFSAKEQLKCGLVGSDLASQQ